MKITYQPINEQNISQALTIYNWYVLHSTATFHLEAISAQELARMVTIGHSKYQSFLILFDDVVSGFCYLSQFRYKEAYNQSAEITLYLDKNFTRKGIGKATVSFLENVAKSKEIKNLVAVITANNTESVSLFKKAHYFKVGHLKNIGVKFGKALDVVSYQKEI